MSAPTIRAALEAAALEVNGRQDCDGPEGLRACRGAGGGPCPCRQIATAAIAAFLRALPDTVVLRLMTMEPDKQKGWRDILAAAVEQAAKEPPNA